MSSESDFAWRMASYYGPGISRMPRGDRIALLEQRIAALLQAGEDERQAHTAGCEECRNGKLCFESLKITPVEHKRANDLSRIRSYVHAEKSDDEYAQKARLHPVIYQHHVDGFCSYWQNVRHRLFVVAGHCCQRCRGCVPLEAHHRHYDTLGFEELADLEALCSRCHRLADQQRGAASRYDAGLATYAVKKYGENWGDQPIECLEEEFDHWLESREDREGAE